MKILVYGAGVIGSIYAVKLYEIGGNVTLLARATHYEILKQNGVIVKDTLTGKQTISQVPLTHQLEADEFYDLIIVTVRLDQFETVVPVLQNNKVCPLIMLMLNNPESIEQLKNQLNPKQIILAFPGAGGIYHDNIVEYIQIKQQETTIGVTNGKISVQITEIKHLFESAGFKVTINDNMEAWLKTHAVFVACIAASINKENGDSVQLGKSRHNIKIMVKSIREGFKACKSLGMPIAPNNLKIIFMVMPQWFSILYWQKAMQGQLGTLAMAPHANKAKYEMKILANKVLTIVHSSSFPTPTLDLLLSSFISSN